MNVCKKVVFSSRIQLKINKARLKNKRKEVRIDWEIRVQIAKTVERIDVNLNFI